MSIPFLSAVMRNVIPFALVLMIIVFVHEMGHFLMARHHGVAVKTFSIGFGPELCGWTDKKGTRWKIGLLLFGGYVMMLGDEEATSTKTQTEGLTNEQKAQTLMAKTPFQRMMVAFGGPLFNILFTILLLSGVGAIKGIPLLAPSVQEVMPDTPAQACGLQKGDVITGINDTAIETFPEMAEILTRFKGQEVTLRYRRGESEQTVPLALYQIKKNGEKEALDKLGVVIAGQTVFRKTSVGSAILYSLTYCVTATKASCQMIGRMITRKSRGEVGSILMVGDGASRSLRQGVFPFLGFMAMLSFSLGFFNLLPIPALDGGSILLNGIELILRRPLPTAVINAVYLLGVGAVGLIMLSALGNDFSRYGIFDKCSAWICRIFSKS